MKKLKFYVPLALIILALGLYALIEIDPLNYVINYLNPTQTIEEAAWQQGDLYVDVIDVGQGDSIFIKTPNGKTMLIDAGDSSAYEAIEQVLEANDVNTLDVLVATHPHADHIGSMKEVFENYGALKIYMSKAVTTTATYKNLLTAISNAGQKITTAKAGVNIDIDPDITMVILSPKDKTYSDLNDYSVVIKCTYQSNSVLFMGDASQNVEAELLADYNGELKSDVLKVSHHGSSSASSVSFLNAVSPEYAIISCGEGNDYGHPHAITLERLTAINAVILRTDQDGPVSFIMDGNNIKFSSK